MRHAVTTCALTLLMSHPVLGQAATDFVGTWELVSIESASGSGGWTRATYAGAQPVGLLMYDAHGNMAVQITTSPRQTVIPGASPEWVNGYVAYYGTYEVDVAAGTVTHHRRNHVNADIGGLSVVRYFAFDDEHLTLTVAPERTVRLTWARVR
jgi:hypothetical protein